MHHVSCIMHQASSFMHHASCMASRRQWFGMLTALTNIRSTKVLHHASCIKHHASTYVGRRPLVDDDLWWKTTFGGRPLLVEDDLRWIIACCRLRFAPFLIIEVIPNDQTWLSRIIFEKWTWNFACNVGSHSPHLLISLGFEWVKYLHFKITKWLKTMFVNSSVTGKLSLRA